MLMILLVHASSHDKCEVSHSGTGDRLLRDECHNQSIGFFPRTCCATAAPHSESHGVTDWVRPTPLTALSTDTSVLA